MNFLTIFDFFKIKKINNRGIKKILVFDLEYLTKISVKKEIDRTSKILEIEKRKGIMNLFFRRNGDEIKFVRV